MGSVHGLAGALKGRGSLVVCCRLRMAFGMALENDMGSGNGKGMEFLCLAYCLRT